MAVNSDLAWYPIDRCFVGGRWIAPSAGETLPLEDPSRGVAIGSIARGTAPDVDAAVASAERALAGDWGRLSATERGRLMMRLSERIISRVEELAQIEALDVGKPLRQGRADALAMARYMEFYAGAADKLMGETIPYLDGYTVYTLREPHGVTGHIVPWNYPMQIAGRTVGAALAMGNACVLKPAEEACLTSLALADLAREAGFPDGALNVVPGLGEEAGAALAAHPGVRHLSFTGSVAVGALVQAAAARHVAPVTLELGGKSPQLVFADADLDRAAPFLVNAGVQNAGQTCSASSRILVERRRYGEVIERMAERYRALRVGPADADLDVGPLISARQKAIVEGFVAAGAISRSRLRRRSSPMRPQAATMSRRSCSPACGLAIASRRRKSSVPSRSSFRSRTRPRPWRSPTARATGWWRASGRRTAGGRCGSPRRCKPGRCSSTITAPAAGSNCRSAASASPDMGARRDSRRFTASPP